MMVLCFGYNLDGLRKANHKQIIKCAFHEVFHLVQHDALKEFVEILYKKFKSESI